MLTLKHSLKQWLDLNQVIYLKLILLIFKILCLLGAFKMTIMNFGLHF
jgi:hypothetical protein